MMKKFHYFFTKDFESIYSGQIRIHKLKTKWDKHAILRILLTLDLDLEYAYSLKERYREFNKAATEFKVRDELISLIKIIFKLRSKGVQRVWKTIKTLGGTNHSFFCEAIRTKTLKMTL